MPTTHILGFPRIGDRRQLKFALEAYWRGASDRQALLDTSRTLRLEHLDLQRQLDWQCVGDFSLYDHVLDTSQMLGNLPPRFQPALSSVDELDLYFQVARAVPTAGANPCPPPR